MIRSIILATLLLYVTAPVASELPAELAGAVATSESAEPAKLLPRQFFLAQPEIALARLSPDESRAAVITREGQDLTLYLLELNNDRKIERFRSKSLRDVRWSGDSQVLFLKTDQGLAAANAGSGRPHLLVRLDTDKEESFLGVTPRGAAAFVSLPAKRGGHEIYRLEVNGERELLLHTEHPVRDLLADETGIRYLRLVEGDTHTLVQLIGNKRRKVFQCDFLDACELLGSSGDKLLLRSDGDGQYRRLLQLDTSSGSVTELHRDPQGIASLDTVQIARDGRTPLIASYRSNYRHNYGLGAATQRVGELERQFSGSDLEIAAHSATGNWLVREERSDYRQPRYFLLRAGSQQPERILKEFPHEQIIGDERQLSAKIPFRFTASDGLVIHAYITLPSGGDLSRTPIIARPHGGPWNRVDSGADVFTQFLANRGYIVFEPNFRASTGYSRDFALAGRGEFGNGRVQQDILDGLDFLLQRGIGDVQKQAIVGHSFGGFSALTGLVFTPDRFRAGLAASPPPDMVSAVIAYGERLGLRANGISWSRSLEELVGELGNPEFVAQLKGQMPGAYPERVRRPLLVIAGGMDKRVDRRRVKGFVSRVQESGTDIWFLLDRDEGHIFQKPLAREAYLYMAETFLARYLGGRHQRETSPPLQSYLQQTLLTNGDRERNATANRN